MDMEVEFLADISLLANFLKTDMKKFLLGALATVFAASSVNVAGAYERKVLVEEFTTEQCSNCPTAAAYMNTMLKTLETEYPGRVFATCHHAGYGTDWLTTEADNAYTALYNNNGSTYAPAFMVDRHIFSLDTPVFGGTASLHPYIVNRLNDMCRAEISVSAVYNADGDMVRVTAKGERSREFTTNPARVTFFVIENNVEAKSQAGASGTFIHQHVMRATNSVWGVEIPWNDDNTFEISRSISIKQAWDKENLEVIAFISDYDKYDYSLYTIENVDGCKILTSGVEEVADTDEVVSSEYFSVDGKRVDADTKGLVIKISHMESGATKSEKVYNR